MSISDMRNDEELAADPYEDGRAWHQHQLELRRQYEEQMMYEELNPVPAANREEEMLDRRERAAAVNSAGKRYY
jgi:hypothetical protein